MRSFVLALSLLSFPLLNVSYAADLPAAYGADQRHALLNFGTRTSFLIFEDGNKKLVKLTSYRINVVLYPTNSKDDLNKILLNPVYIAKKRNPGDSDFNVSTEVMVVGQSKPIGETALCTWNNKHSRATCGVEDDGGYFYIDALERRSALRDSVFKMVVTHINGYNGFRIGNVEGSGRSVFASNPAKRPVSVLVKFDR